MINACLALNAGSSSLKFQFFDADAEDETTILYRGLFERLTAAARFSVRDADGKLVDEATWPEETPLGHEGALSHLISWLKANRNGRELVAIGHRIVHGGESFRGPTLIDEGVVHKLERLIPLAPLHQPFNLEPVRIVQRRLPSVPQVACFDTSFHLSQPIEATTFALPKRVRDLGVRRYGFHGLSYDYISSVLANYDPKLASGRVIVAHLGSGASLCALHKGVSVATTMGFSALDGLPMGTRCGGLDPGAVFFMIREMKMTPDEVEQMLYKDSGLLGLSGLSNDMRVLREASATNIDARLAVDYFVYRIQREAGSLMAALGGLDGIIFTAGIGENDIETRSRVLKGLSWTGIELDEAANRSGKASISRGSGPSAWVIPTNEELVISRQMRRMLGIADRRAPAHV